MGTLADDLRNSKNSQLLVGTTGAFNFDGLSGLRGTNYAQVGNGLEGLSNMFDSRDYSTPDPTSNFKSGAKYGAGGGGSVADPNAIAEANDLIAQSQNLLGRLSGQRTIGNDNITNTFGAARTGLTSDKNRVTRDYTDSKNQSTQQNEVAKARIDTQVRNRSNALQRFLGASGGGDSEASLRLAPYAAARTGTNLRQQVNDAYSGNMQSLDKSFGDYNADFDSSWADLDAQEKNKRNDLESQLLNQELGARDNLRRGQGALEYAKTGNTAAASQLRQQSLPLLFQILQQIDNLSRQEVNPNVKTAAYEAPELASYATSNLQAVNGGEAPEASDISPAYQYLLNKQKADEDYFGY